MSRRLPLALIGLTALTATAFALRAWGFDARIPWYDEIGTYLYARGPWLDEMRRATTEPFIPIPPLYFSVLSALDALGWIDGTMRAPSVIFGALAVPALYRLARRFGPPSTALAAAALLTIAPLHVRYAQEARSYTLLVLAVILCLTALIDQVRVETPTRRHRWFVVTTGAMTAWCHLVGLGVVGSGLVWLAWVDRRRTTRVTIAIAAAFVAPLFVLVAVGALGHMGVGGAARSAPLGPERAWAFLGWYGYLTRAPAGVGVWWLPACVAAGLYAGSRRRDPAHRRAIALLVVVCVLPTLVLGLVPWRHYFRIRYALQCLPVLCLFAAMGADVVPARWRRWVLPTGIAVSISLALVPLRRLYREQTSRWDVAADVINTLARPDDAVAVFDRDAELRPHFREMAKDQIRPFLDSPRPTYLLSPDSPDRLVFRQGAARVWIVGRLWPNRRDLDRAFRHYARTPIIRIFAHHELTRPELDLLGPRRVDTVDLMLVGEAAHISNAEIYRKMAARARASDARVRVDRNWPRRGRVR